MISSCQAQARSCDVSSISSAAALPQCCHIDGGSSLVLVNQRKRTCARCRLFSASAALEESTSTVPCGFILNIHILIYVTNITKRGILSIVSNDQ